MFNRGPSNVTWISYLLAYIHTILKGNAMQSNRKRGKKASSEWKRFYRFDVGATRLVPALVVVVVVAPALRAALLAVAPVTPGRGLVLGGGFIVVLLLVVPRPPAGGGGLAGDVGGLSFCRFAIVFSLSNPAVAAVRVLVVGLVGAFSWGLSPMSFALLLSLAVVVAAAFLTSTFGFGLIVAEVVVVFLIAEGFAFLGDVGVFLTFRGGSGSTSIEIPNSSSSVSSFSTSLPFPRSSSGFAQSSSIKVASGARLSKELSTAIESKGSSDCLDEEATGRSRGGDALSAVRTLLRGLGFAGEYA